MAEYMRLVKDLRDKDCCWCQECAGDSSCGFELKAKSADAIEELLAKVPTAERLAEILSRYFQIGDSYTFELTRVKEAFAIGTMSFDDFSEWDDENVSDLAEYIMESLSTPPKGVE